MFAWAAVITCIVAIVLILAHVALPGWVLYLAIGLLALDHAYPWTPWRGRRPPH